MPANDCFDIAVIGAGPAGTAAAIYAALKGLRVVLVESHSSNRLRPGESLPPGIEIIFQQLGVWKAICDMNCIRNRGHYTLNDKYQEKIFHSYGGDKQGEWLGFQIPRDKLDAILQNRAQELGVIFFLECHIKNLKLLNNKIKLVTESEEQINATYYIDATGSWHLFARNLGIKIIPYSPTLIARYGYLENDCPYEDLPIFIKDEEGWSWYAKVDPHVYAWVRVDQSKSKHKEKVEKHKVSGGADVTWRIAKQLAGPQFFLVGDAACVLDPSAGHGVLRALMTGMMAAHIISSVTKNIISHEAGSYFYNRWLSSWFESDVNELQKRATV